MADEAFHANLRAHRAHMEQVPVALALARTYAVGDGAADLVTPATVATLVAEIDRMHRLEKRLRQEMAEEQRQFQRDARDIAAEARWQGQEETRGGNY